MSTAYRAAAVATLLVLAACSSGDEGSPPSSAGTSPTTSTKTPLTVPSTPDAVGVVAAPASLVEAARAEAGAAAGVPTDDIVVVSARTVVWSDAGLGCAPAGTSVAQVLTEGYWIVLQAGDRVFDYRAGLDEQLRPCTNGAPPVDVIVDQ